MDESCDEIEECKESDFMGTISKNKDLVESDESLTISDLSD
jgi:hypothetical protein